MSGRVIVVGSVNVDLVVRGARLPGPGETVTGGVFERHHGGKGGNQAVAAARLGRPTLLIGAVGADEFGVEARRALQQANVDVSGLATVEGAATGVALILVDEAGENSISVASGANALLTAELVVAALARLGPLGGDVVLVSREISGDVIRAALSAARAAGARTILNPAPADGLDLAELDLADVLTPNRGELTLATGALAVGASRPEPQIQARRLAGPGGIREAIVVTLGSDGALVVPAGGADPTVIPVHAVTAVDTTGAGDAFSGALAALLATGRSIVEAATGAVIAAGLSTTVPGAREGMPTLQELEAALRAADRGLTGR